MPCEFFWITDGSPEEVVGFLALRTRLNDWLLDEGGHIGYSVRPVPTPAGSRVPGARRSPYGGLPSSASSGRS